MAIVTPVGGSVVGVGGVVEAFISASHHMRMVLMSVGLKVVRRPGVKT